MVLAGSVDNHQRKLCSVRLPNLLNLSSTHTQGTSICMWISNTAFQQSRLTYTKKFLKITGKYHPSDATLLERFVNQYLRQDGIFILRILAKNAGDLIVSEIVNAMWVNYKTRFEMKE